MKSWYFWYLQSQTVTPYIDLPSWPSLVTKSWLGKSSGTKDLAKITIEIKDIQRRDWFHCVHRTFVSAKNKRLGNNDCRIDPKVTCTYSNKENPNRCMAALYKEFISHRPQVSTTDAFYQSPKKSITNTIWYKNQSYSIHSIEKVNQQIMSTKKKCSTVHEH